MKDNFNIFNLFLTKDIKVFLDNQQSFKIHVPTIRELVEEETINGIYHLLADETELKKFFPNIENSFQALRLIFFELGIYKEYSAIFNNFKQGLKFFIPSLEIDYTNKEFKIENITMTQEIWEYILYLIKLSYGEKVEKPRTFASEDERQFYLAQKKMDEKIKKIKAQKPGDSEGLLKSFLTIQYKFNLSFDYLAEQTMAQIQWLQGYAAGAVSYEVNAQAFAAGNMKKGKKLDFFIK